MLNCFTIKYFDNSIIELHCREGTQKKKEKKEKHLIKEKPKKIVIPINQGTHQY